MTKSNSPSNRLTTPIAIVGLSAIFAKAANLPEYWDNIVKKIDGITDVPLSRWDVADYYDADPAKPDKTYCKRGGFIPDIAFDPLEFGLPPNILEVTDVSQLLTLVVAILKSFQALRLSVTLLIEARAGNLRPAPKVR